MFIYASECSSCVLAPEAIGKPEMAMLFHLITSNFSVHFLSSDSNIVIHKVSVYYIFHCFINSNIDDTNLNLYHNNQTLHIEGMKAKLEFSDVDSNTESYIKS
jgi:hypothetical protein